MCHKLVQANLRFRQALYGRRIARALIVRGKIAARLDEKAASRLNSDPLMLRQAELWRVLGRRLTERLLRSGWIEPVYANGRIYYEKRTVHSALKRVQKEGFLLSGRVRSGSLSAWPKVRKRSLEETLGDVELNNLFPE